MDNGFTTPYQAYTLAEMISWPNKNEKMINEIARRQAVLAGDRSVMTNGEKLRELKARKRA